MTDRAITYPGQIPLETDILRTNKNAMMAIAGLAHALFGTTTIADGLACTPTGPASLNVLVGPGWIYELKNVDDTAYSSIAADTTHQIMKQGVLLDNVTLSCPAAGTGGFSINYLIQATLTESDSASVVLPYYNSSNPATAYSGPANSGTPQPTVRGCAVTLTAKAGTAAATGTQTTPSPDANNIGLWVVTVDNGETTIVSGDIVAAAGAPVVPVGGILAAIVGTVYASRAEAIAGTNTTKAINADDLAQAVISGAFFNGGTAGGSANALTAVIAPAPASLYTGLLVFVVPASANTGPATINLNATGVKNIKIGSSALAGGEMAVGRTAALWYDGTEFELLNPVPGTGFSPSYATGSDVQTGTDTAKIVTARALADAGVPYIVASSIVANGGYEVWSNGVIECWGFVDVPQASAATVTLPYAHTSWVIPTGSGGLNSIGASDNALYVTSITGSPPTAFSVTNSNGSIGTVRFWWRTKGK